jgi:hypothetical protein
VLIEVAFVSEILPILTAVVFFEFGEEFLQAWFEVVQGEGDEFGVEFDQVSVEVVPDFLLQLLAIGLFELLQMFVDLIGDL